MTGDLFPDGGNQPGLLSGDKYYEDIINAKDYDAGVKACNAYNDRYLAGDATANKNLVDVVRADSKAIGLNFEDYKEGMTGGVRVKLVVNPNNDYHWFVYNEDEQQWYNKNGPGYATCYELTTRWFLFIPIGTKLSNKKISDVDEYAKALGYTVVVGEYYITEVEEWDEK